MQVKDEIDVNTMLLFQSQMNTFRDMLQREVRESEERLQNHEKVSY